MLEDKNKYWRTKDKERQKSITIFKALRSLIVWNSRDNISSSEFYNISVFYDKTFLMFSWQY